MVRIRKTDMALPYTNLWNASLYTPSSVREAALEDASRWPGWPSRPSDSNHIEFDVERYFKRQVQPAKPYGGRVMKRGGYTGLSNYNVVP